MNWQTIWLAVLTLALVAHMIKDAAFAASLRRAFCAGVQAFAYRCRVQPEEGVRADRIPVRC